MCNDVEIKRDHEEEAKNPKYTYYKMYFKNEIIGLAKYRLFLFDGQSPYWYIDELAISEQYRGKGYGSFFLRDLINKMWNEQKLPIHIYPIGFQIPKEKFIKWLVTRGFIEEPNDIGQRFCILHPPDLA